MTYLGGDSSRSSREDNLLGDGIILVCDYDRSSISGRLSFCDLLLLLDGRLRLTGVAPRRREDRRRGVIIM